jgi:hypothetical protein
MSIMPMVAGEDEGVGGMGARYGVGPEERRWTQRHMDLDQKEKKNEMNECFSRRREAGYSRSMSKWW